MHLLRNWSSSQKFSIFLRFSLPLQLLTVRLTSGSDSSNYCQSQTREFLVPERCFHPNIQLFLVGPSPQSAHQPHQTDSSAGTALQLLCRLLWTLSSCSEVCWTMWDGLEHFGGLWRIQRGRIAFLFRSRERAIEMHFADCYWGISDLLINRGICVMHCLS